MAVSRWIGGDRADGRERVSVDLSIIIVNWNTRDLLARCLESVIGSQLAVTVQPSITTDCRTPITEVFVVDNASNDGSAAKVRQDFPCVRLIENQENVGFARANNQAIRLAMGRYILLLNSDTIVMPEAIARMVVFLDKNQDVGVLGPELLNSDREVQRSWAKFPTVWSELWGVHHRERIPCTSHSSVQREKFYEVDWMAGACLLIRRSVIRQVGLLDERFFLYSEETDWCLRIKSAGWRIVYLPGAQVVHLEGKSAAHDLPRTSFLLYHSKLLYAYKHLGVRRAMFLRIGFVGLNLLKALVRLLSGYTASASAHWRLAKQLLEAPLKP